MEAMPKIGKLPRLAPGSPGRPENNRYREQYGVIVICRDEKHQQEVYKALRGNYSKVKVVRT
jgi:hypothetical protein